MSTTNKVRFRVAGKITKLLGRESVSESITALFEILKNSHDADCLNATVQFKDILSGAGKIIIKEKGGDGMTYEDITEKFFVIGTSAKELEDGSARITRRYQRTMLGNKGVGRFALERLGKEAKVVSRPIDSNDMYTFVINWDKFEPREVTVDQVGIDIIPDKRSDTENSGLEIEISRLRDEWNEEAIKRLEGKIQRLMLPEKFQPPNAFNITLDAPEFGYNNKPITVTLLTKSYYSLKAELLDGRIKVTAKKKGIDVISSKHKNDIITEFRPYEYGAKITKTEKRTGLKLVEDLTCGPVKLDAYYFPIFQTNTPENRDALRHYGEVFGQILDNELPNHAGVRIFRDGMREFSYGDPGNDWVERASISRNLSGTVQADRLVGYVFTSHKDNPKIIPTTNRESAIQNQAFLDLREFVIQSMLHFDHYLNQERRKMLEARHDLKKDREAVNQLQVIKKKLTARNSTITKAFRRVRDITGEDYTPEIGSFLDAIDNAQSRLEEKIEAAGAFMTENQLQRSLASLGVIVSMMIHEINDAVTITNRESKKLKRHTSGIEKLTPIELNQVSKFISHYMETIVTWNNLVDRFSNSLTLDDLRSRKENIINPYEVTARFISDIKKILLISDIKIENEIDKKLKIKIYGAYFESIIGNLLSNSVKAFASLDGEDKRENKIIIKTEKRPEHLIIYFSDNGPGIPKERWDLVFEPHISSTSRYRILKGHGLGLPIVHSMVRDYHGDIKIIESIQARGTTFRITFPWKSIDPKS